MFCTSCGKEIPNGSKFCGNCGAPVSGAKDPVVSVPSAASSQKQEAELFRLKNISKYKGTPVAGYSEATGTLLVYHDRLEFKPKSGSATWGHGGIIGLGISAALGHSAPVEVYKIEQITELHEGKYMGIYNTLVMSLANGGTWSFCPVLPGSSVPKEIVSTLAPALLVKK